VREVLESLPENEGVAYTTVQTLVYRLSIDLRKGASVSIPISVPVSGTTIWLSF
jgi:hypothetical protein